MQGVKTGMNNEKLKKGDIVLNGYAAKGINDLHIIIGSTSRRTGLYSTTSYYECRMLYQGKLQAHKSLFNKRDHKLKKIGHFNFEEAIKNAMEEAYKKAN